MSQPSLAVFEPRKSPMQARSSASVEAILEATVQVLRQVGKERLTTTRVAARAGVSVGTLYQYFPNKSALLQAALRRHLMTVFNAMEAACEEQKGQPLAQMATALIHAFLGAKMKDARTSVALYSVSSDVDGARIAHQIGTRANKAVAAMLATSCDPLHTDPQLAASMLQSAMFGVSRRLLESSSPEKLIDTLREELLFLAHAYLKACSARTLEQESP